MHFRALQTSAFSTSRFFCLLVHRPAVRISLPFHIFLDIRTLTHELIVKPLIRKSFSSRIKCLTFSVASWLNETRISRSLLPDYNMFKSISVHRIAVLLLALTIYGAHVKGDEALGDTENQKNASSRQNVEVDTRSDSWIANLMWNLLGYETVIIPFALIILMVKNSNLNERSGKMFTLFVLRVHPVVVHVCFCLTQLLFSFRFFFI